MAEAVQTPRERRQNRGFILGSLSLGHGISHLYDQGFSVFLTAIAQSLGLTNFQVAALLGIRQGGFGVVNLGGGVFVDRARSNWGPILTFCMLWSALAFVAIAASPNLAILIVAVSMVSIPGALWHLPATAALSRRFPDRRGFAISIHGFGSNVGNVLGPLLAGVLLSYLLWRHVLYLYAIPAVIMTIFVWWSLRELGNEGEEERDAGRRMGAQVRDGLRLFRNPVVMALTVAAAIRGVATGAMFNWAPFYLESTEFGGLGMSYILTGVHMALLTGMGVVSTPILGYLSDRYGRKVVLAPGLAVAADPDLFRRGGGGHHIPRPFDVRCGSLQLCTATDHIGGGAGRGGEGHRGHGFRVNLRVQWSTGVRIPIPGYADNPKPGRIRLHLLLLGYHDGGCLGLGAGCALPGPPAGIAAAGIVRKLGCLTLPASRLRIPNAIHPARGGVSQYPGRPSTPIRGTLLQPLGSMWTETALSDELFNFRPTPAVRGFSFAGVRH